MKKESRELNEELIPLDAAVLADIDYYRAKLCQMDSDHREFIQALAEKAQQLDNTDARKLECEIEVRDIKLSATALRQYMGIVQNLLDGITGDMHVIYRRRKIFQQAYAEYIAKVIEEQKRQESNEKAKERMRKMRAKEGSETE
jgi:hypothetical protein